jgi:DNA polymerase-1
MPEPCLLLIDFPNLAFRAHFVKKKDAQGNDMPELTAPDGTIVGPLHRFLSMTLALAKEVRATHWAFAFDSAGPTFRALLDPEYKAGRPEAGDEFHASARLMNIAAGKLGCARFRAEGFEADDALAALAAQAEAHGFRAAIATGDKDMMGAVTDRTELVWTAQGMAKIRENRYTPAMVAAKYGVPPDRIADWKALAGDSGDNIKGCPGIGPGTATTLLTAYDSLDGVFAASHAAADDPEGFEASVFRGVVAARFRNSLAAGEEMSRKSLVMATLRRDAPVVFDPAEGVVGGGDRAALLAFLRRYALASIESRLPPVPA